MRTALKIIAVTLLGISSFACGGGSSQGNSNSNTHETPAPTAELKARSFESDLESVKYNTYTWVFVLRRKDGKAFDSEDIKMVRAYTRAETNQRLVSDDGKAIIMGSNFRFYPGQWDALHRMFDVQDLSETKYEKNEFDDESPDEKKKADPKSSPKTDAKKRS